MCHAPNSIAASRYKIIPCWPEYMGPLAAQLANASSNIMIFHFSSGFDSIRGSDDLFKVMLVARKSLVAR